MASRRFHLREQSHCLPPRNLSNHASDILWTVLVFMVLTSSRARTYSSSLFAAMLKDRTSSLKVSSPGSRWFLLSPLVLGLRPTIGLKFRKPFVEIIRLAK